MNTSRRATLNRVCRDTESARKSATSYQFERARMFLQSAQDEARHLWRGIGQPDPDHEAAQDAIASAFVYIEDMEAVAL